MAEKTEVEDIDLESPELETVLEVKIPENTAAGDAVTVLCPDNTHVQFVTPENVVAGDTVHVHVSTATDGENIQSSSAEATVVSGNSYAGVAAVTTGVVVSALVIGPVVTGVLVVGMVVAAAQRKKARNTVSPTQAPEVVDVEAGQVPEESESSKQEASAEQTEPVTREEKIASALVKTADFIVDKLTAIDERLAISDNTLKAIAAVQELDERNKFSETVVTNVKNFDEKYQVSETATQAVNTTITKVKEFDESYRVSEKVVNAGSNVAQCVTDFERRHDISTRITTALIFAMSTLTEAITAYMQRIGNSPEGTATDGGDVHGASEATGTAPLGTNGLVEPSAPLGAAPLGSVVDQHLRQSPTPVEAV